MVVLGVRHLGMGLPRAFGSSRTERGPPFVGAPALKSILRATVCCVDASGVMRELAGELSPGRRGHVSRPGCRSVIQNEIDLLACHGRGLRDPSRLGPVGLPRRRCSRPAPGPSWIRRARARGGRRSRGMVPSGHGVCRHHRVRRIGLGPATIQHAHSFVEFRLRRSTRSGESEEREDPVRR